MKIFGLFSVGFALLLASCATINQNIDARKNLALCKYEFVSVDLTDLHLTSDLLLDSVDFNVNLKVTNNAPTDVAVDHLEGDLFLDANNVVNLAHKEFSRIAPKKFAVEKIAVQVPFGGVIKQLGHRPDTLTVKAKVWVTILLGKATWETPLAIPVSITIKIPYDKIDQLIEQKKKEAADAVQKKVRDEAADKAKQAADAVKGAIKSPF